MDERPVTAEELFDALGEDYEKAFGKPPIVDEALRWLLDELPEHSRVLDIGSGTGRPAAHELASAGHTVTGVDVSAAMVKIARRQVPGAEFVHADVREWDGQAAGWDAVCAFFPFLQMNRAETEGLFADIARWLVPEGLLALVTVPMDVEEMRVEFLGRPVYITSFAADDLLERLAAAGLEVLATRSEMFHPDQPDAVAEEHLLVTARRPG